MGTRTLVLAVLLTGCFGHGDDYGGGGGGGGGPRPDAGPDACMPRTCAVQGASCGSVEDGCGGMLDCGTCQGDAVCGGQGVDSVCALPEAERTCADGWCWEAPAPFAFDPEAVFALSSSDAWAVGKRGAVMHFDGSGWNAVSANTTADINDIWMASANDGWLVGAGGVIRRWNGTTWSAVASNTTADLRGVWGTAANDVWIVGEAVTRRWNGSLLVSPATTTPSLGKVFVAGANVFAVGGEYVWQLVATTWTKRTSDSPTFETYSFAAIGGTATEVYALGREHGLTAGEDLGYYWNGSSWTRHFDPGDPEWTDAYAVGNNIYGVSDESITNLADTTRIQGPGGTMRAAAGANASIFVATSASTTGQLYHRGAGETWQNDRGFGDRHGLRTIAHVGDSIWFGGADGTLIEWNGGVIVHEPPTTRDIVAIGGSARDDLWIADTINMYRFDGTRWTPASGAVVAAYPTSIVAVGADLFAIGRYVYRYTNATWTMETIGTDHPTWLAAAEHGGELYIAGSLDGAPDVARVAHRANGTWTDLPAPAMERACGIAVAAANDIWVAGYDSMSPANATVAHYDGTTWTTQTFTGAGKLCSIELHGGEVWASGMATALYRRSSAGMWTSSQPLALGSIRAMREIGGELWAVGDHGAVLRRP